MRLKEDSNSWRAGGVIRRDARHDKGTGEVPCHRRMYRPSRTRWCRGKTGQEHRPVWVHPKNWAACLVYTCQSCGKQLDFYYSCRHDRPPPVLGSVTPLKKRPT